MQGRREKGKGREREEQEAECLFPDCFFCVMKDRSPGKRRSGLANFFKELPGREEEGQVIAVSGIWNRAMAHPNDPELVELGVMECMAALMWKGIEDRSWLAQDQNVYVPYYAAHIVGSYCMNVEAFAERAVAAAVVPPLLELLRGRLTWVEQRVAVRALGHIATYDSTFPQVAAYDEVLDLAVQLAMNALDIVYVQFVQAAGKREPYHCDLLTRGMGGAEMEARKAEEWASQLQCWSLQLINCFAFKDEFLCTICKSEFLGRLPAMWGGLVNEVSPAGVGLLRTICHQKAGRPLVADCPVVVQSLCNISRSSDDWQYMAVDCLVWLLQDSKTRFKVLEAALEAIVDLAELSSLGSHQKAGELITAAVLRKYATAALSMQSSHLPPRTIAQLKELSRLWQRMKSERNLPKEDFRLKQAAALVVKLEGNAKFSAGDIAGAALKYSQALEVCPLQAKKERVVLFSNRAQCHLLRKDAKAAISDATRALCLHDPVNRHSSSLWRRAQAYAALGLVKESLLDAILFINECTQTVNGEPERRAKKVPPYVEKFVKKQMKEAWLFKDAAAVYGPIQYQDDIPGSPPEESDGDSEWETASDEE